MRIHILNSDYFDKNLSLKVVAKTGVLFAAALIAGNTFLNTTTPPERESIPIPAIIQVDHEAIQEMNVILNDNRCGEIFFDSVCDQLREDGVSFQETKNNQRINVEGSTVITLDQQYNSGVNSIVFAPSNNTLLGNSDSLALAMRAGLEEQGLSVKEITSEQVGYRVDENGNVRHSVPTSTEEAINTSYDTSFVTVSLGTGDRDPKKVAKGIESALARQNYFLEYYDSQPDTLYHANAGEEVQTIADYFHTTVQDLRSMNHLGSEDILEDQTIINPSVGKMPIFQKDAEFKIEEKNHNKTY